MSFVALLAAALVAAPGQDGAGAPQQVQDPTSSTRLEDVVVEQRRLDEVVRQFVGEVGAAAPRRGLARWQDEVCVGVVNVRPAVGHAIADHISRIALELGLDVGEPGCRANVVIVFTEDGAELADAMVERNRRAFRPGVSGADRGNPALRDFRTTSRPVRWWHVSLPVDSETGQVAVRLPGEAPPVVNVFAASRLNSQVRDDLSKVMVVVDVDELAGVNLPQLADYLAFLSLAQVDPDADTTSFNTVLNLFADSGAVEGLTEWDRTYLTSLYRVQDTPIRRINAGAQAAVMAADMTRRRRAQQAAAEPATD